MDIIIKSDRGEGDRKWGRDKVEQREREGWETDREGVGES